MKELLIKNLNINRVYPALMSSAIKGSIQKNINNFFRQI
jgi:hypothetical protein